MPLLPNIPAPVTRDLETLMDAYAYLLSTDSRTTNIDWILGDVGMGSPATLPFGYISVINEALTWYTANGGQGGLAAGGSQGLDDWTMPIILTVCFEPHRFITPTSATPPASSPFSPQQLGGPSPYLEQPGWRNALEQTQLIKATLRTNVTLGGAATDTRVVESRYIIQEINSNLYRASRITIQSQQRRVRGT